jgi:site-specific DNA-cytosine methylase
LRAVAPTLSANYGKQPDSSDTSSGTPLVPVANSLAANSGRMQVEATYVPVAVPMAVRRLTPRECERLQGFPDDHTLIDYRGKPAADGPRYKALGNSMAVPVMSWIGRRLAAVEAITQRTEVAA